MSVLPPPIPILEVTDGCEWTANPERVTLREAFTDNTKAGVGSGGVFGCWMVAPRTPVSVKFSNPSTTTYSEQVPVNSTVAGENLSILVRVRFKDPPLSQLTIGVGAAAAQVVEKRRIPKASGRIM
jgi:hypothetical protein